MPRLAAEHAERRDEEGHGPDFLEALARGLAVLQAFGPDRRQMTLAEAGRAVGLPRATVRRALHTLAALGHVETDGRLFRLTPRVLRLASGYLGANGVSAILQPCCDRLAAEIRSPCSAAVLDGEDIVFVAYGHPARMPSLTSMIGARLPAFCSALGRVLLAGLPDAELDRFLAALRPVRLTPRTELDPACIRAEILAARLAGHALVDEEVEAGFRSLAVPLRRWDGRVLAALNIGMHSGRCTTEELRSDFLDLLLSTAEDVGAQLL